MNWPAYPAGTALPINTHAYGGTRMGDDPAKSVVDKYGLAHEAPNLMILGGSTFPGRSGYTPTETIQAHAWFAASIWPIISTTLPCRDADKTGVSC